MTESEALPMTVASDALATFSEIHDGESVEYVHGQEGRLAVTVIVAVIPIPVPPFAGMLIDVGVML